MSGKRITLLIFTILWYVATIAVIVSFILGLLHGKASLGYFIGYFIGSMLLSLWQIIIVGICANMYDFTSYVRWGGSGGILGIILFIIFAPLTLIWHIFYTFKPLWLLIRYDPYDY